MQRQTLATRPETLPRWVGLTSANIEIKGAQKVPQPRSLTVPAKNVL
jgi:hypothetical protein